MLKENIPEEDHLERIVTEIARDALTVSRELATIPTETKNAVLKSLADLLDNSEALLMAANAKDLAQAEKDGLQGAMLDRLKFTPARMRKMADGVRQVVQLPDPVGEVIEQTTRPNGMVIDKVRVPIGVVGIIYESRPNVTIDCAALCFKSGNASILRGGKEAFHSNTALASLIAQALEEHQVNPKAVQLIPTTERSALNTLLKLDQYMHCIIPRGGEGLINFVNNNARMPVIKHYKGVCYVYVDTEANLDMAESFVVNAKCQRPGVCCAAENLFIARTIADVALPRMARALLDRGVELRVDSESEAILKKSGIPCKPATESDYSEEYLDLIIAIKLVDDVKDAKDTINKYGSGHSDSIITENRETGELFLQGVDSAAVYHNVTTYFTDGYEFGLGAEIGISTDRLHARGPMGLRELTSYKYLIRGSGQIRT